MEYIPQMEPSFDDKERKALNEYMLSGGWLMEFKKTREFEQMIAEYTGARYCSIMPNGTLSLSVALLACGIGVGDEVIVPDYTMIATPNAAELIGARAVFVDIDKDNLCMDFQKMKEKVNEKTKAFILVSINGRFPDNINEFVDYCKMNNIWLIEDAAQSLGSKFENKHIGTFGDIGSFSFSVPKIITTGQGGALITNNSKLYENIKLIRDFGREKGGSDKYMVKGWNFKFTDLQAVVGIEQMKKMGYRIKRKKEMAKIYQENLSGIDGVDLIKTNLEQTSPWFFDILCENRSGLINYLKDNGIGSREFYPPLHSEQAYSYSGSYPVTEEISARGLWLPSAVTLSNEQVEYVCKKIKQFYM